MTQHARGFPADPEVTLSGVSFVPRSSASSWTYNHWYRKNRTDLKAVDSPPSRDPEKKTDPEAISTGLQSWPWLDLGCCPSHFQGHQNDAVQGGRAGCHGGSRTGCSVRLSTCIRLPRHRTCVREARAVVTSDHLCWLIARYFRLRPACNKHMRCVVFKKQIFYFVLTFWRKLMLPVTRLSPSGSAESARRSHRPKMNSGPENDRK